jgi:hypothetical protein
MKTNYCCALLLSLMTLGATAQPVYRCGNEYTRVPCVQGKVVDATDPRTTAQLAEARRVAADEKRLADDMRRERLADQALQKPAAASSLGGTPAAPVKAASSGDRRPPKLKRVPSKTKPSATKHGTKAEVAAGKPPGGKP